jgi:hypothetical protein
VLPIAFVLGRNVYLSFSSLTMIEHNLGLFNDYFSIENNVTLNDNL